MKWTRSVWGPSLGVCGMARSLDSSSTGGRGKAALVGFGRTATRARRGLGATFPVAALFSEGSQAQLLGCLSRLTPSSGFHFSDCATTHCLKWTLKAIPLDLKGPYRCYKNPSSLDQPKSPSSLDDQLQLYQGSSGYVTFHSNHQSHTDLNILPLLSFQFNVSHKDHNFRVKQCHFFSS